MELRQLLTALKRRWKFVVAVFLSGVIGALLVSWAVTPMYESTVRVYFGASNTTATDQIQLGTYTAQRAKTYAALAEDASVREAVVDRAKVGASADELAERVEIEVVPDTVVLKVVVRDAEPRVAQTLADAYAAEIASTVAKLEKPSGAKAESAIAPVEARTQGKATVSSGPVSPDFTLNLAVGAILGLLFGIGGAVLRELLDSEPADQPMPESWPRTQDVLREHAR